MNLQNLASSLIVEIPSILRVAQVSPHPLNLEVTCGHFHGSNFWAHLLTLSPWTSLEDLFDICSFLTFCPDSNLRIHHDYHQEGQLSLMMSSSVFPYSCKKIIWTSIWFVCCCPCHPHHHHLCQLWQLQKQLLLSCIDLDCPFFSNVFEDLTLVSSIFIIWWVWPYRQGVGCLCLLDPGVVLEQLIILLLMRFTWIYISVSHLGSSCSTFLDMSFDNSPMI